MLRWLITLPGIVLSIVVLGSIPADAQVIMNNYAARPPFASTGVTTPNVLFVVDASSSMRRLAAQEVAGDAGLGEWDHDNTYSGYFDPMRCYDYDSTNKRFVVGGGAKASISATCPASRWDGNFLNWATLRRFDAAKIALNGGACIDTVTDQVGYRDVDGNCLPSGSPAKITVTAHHRWTSNSGSQGGHVTTPAVKGPGFANSYDGRVPSGVQSGAGGNDLYFHIRGGMAGMQGTFCTALSSTAPSDSATSCNDPGDSYVEQQFYIRVAMDIQPQGVIQQVGGQARLGLMMFSSGSGVEGKGWLTVPIGSRQARDQLGTTIETFTTNTAAILDAVDESIQLRGTPAVESLYEAIRYYAQLGEYDSTAFHTLAYSPAVALGANGTGSLGSGEITVLTGGEACPGGYIASACGRDPMFFGSDHTPPWAVPSAAIPCCENYIILLTDGAPNNQTALPLSLVDYGHSVHGAHDPAIDNEDYDLVGLAYWGHIHDLRQSTVPVIGETGHDLPGFQNVTVYTFFAFGETDGRNLLQLTAKFGGFQDTDAPGDPGYNEPDKVSEYDKVNNYTGAAGADGIPDTYFESSNANDLKDKLTATLASILQQSGSGSAASVLASSSTGEGAVYQSYFYPSTVEGLRTIKWIGYTQGLFLDAFGNLREDTDDNYKLTYKDDKIIRTRFDTATNEVVVDRYDDSDANGLADTFLNTVPLKQINGIWEAGERLALTASTSRNIITWVDTDNNRVVDGGEQIQFTTANSSTIEPYLDPTDSSGNPLPAPFTTSNIINFIRGDQVAGMRDRELTVGGSLNVWKLGDPIHARPITVAAPAQRYDVFYGDSSYTAFFNQYKNRRQVVYVGANDGMLHAFNAGFYHPGDDPGTTAAGEIENGWFTRTPTDNSSGPLLGDELWGFIPQELLPHLKWLTRPDYSHVYYVDLTPKVTDARIFTPDADHPNGWGTILMGGFRLGGSCGNCAPATGAPPMAVTADFNGDGDTTDPDDTRTFYSAYFVLDITNPETDPKLVWSFSSSDLGLTTTVPSMLRVNPAASSITANTDAKWYMLVGSGPTGYDGSIAQAGKLFAIDLVQGPGVNNGLVSTLPAETLNAFMASPVTIDRDFDYRVEVAYMGSTIHDGSLPWRGKLYRMTMNDCTVTPCSTGTWGIASGSDRQPTEILDTFPASNTIELGPVTTAPAVAIDDSNKLWVFAGSGRYYGINDKANTDQQYFVGVKDSVLNGACTESTRINCHDNDLIDVSSAQVCLVGTGDCGGITNQVTGVGGASDFASLVALVASKDGWYTTLPTSGERALSRPIALGGIVLFPTFVPANDPCAASGESYLYALYYRTGSAYSSPVIGTSPGSGSNKIVNRSTSLGVGMASQAVVHIGKGGSGGKATAYIQKSSGEITSIGFNSPAALPSRFMTWYRALD